MAGINLFSVLKPIPIPTQGLPVCSQQTVPSRMWHPGCIILIHNHSIKQTSRLLHMHATSFLTTAAGDRVVTSLPCARACLRTTRQNAVAIAVCVKLINYSNRCIDCSSVGSCVYILCYQHSFCSDQLTIQSQAKSPDPRSLDLATRFAPYMWHDIVSDACLNVVRTGVCCVENVCMN